MNERINQLAKQAGGNYGEGLEFAVVFGELKDLEKFAELIVRECANIVNDNYFHGSSVGDRMLFEHFGVEE